MSRAAVWRIIVALAIVSAGAAVGDERPREPSQYFWDMASYVTALDSPNPYHSDAFFAFLYPPAAADIFKLAGTHLFEFMSIAYVGAIALFLGVFARLDVPRRFEWLFAVTAMGGLGVVSLKAGNIAIVMNLTLLALVLDAAMGGARSMQLLPIAIGFGGLIKPQFLLYLGVLPVLGPWRKGAIKILAVAALVMAVHGGYIAFRPELWNGYVDGVRARTFAEQDFGWGSAALFMHATGSNGGALLGFAGSLGVVSLLSFLAWRKSAQASLSSAACLAVVVLTFANPRVPLYDLYLAGIALAICCGCAGRIENAWAMAAALAINLVPWSIANFARNPGGYPWWSMDMLVTQMAGLALLLLSLVRTGIAAPPVREG